MQGVPQDSHDGPESIVQCTLSNVRPVLSPLPWRAIPMPSHTLNKEPFPGIQPKSLLTHSHTILLGPATGHQREDVTSAPFPLTRKF